MRSSSAMSRLGSCGMGLASSSCCSSWARKRLTPVGVRSSAISRSSWSAWVRACGANASMRCASVGPCGCACSSGTRLKPSCGVAAGAAARPSSTALAATREMGPLSGLRPRSSLGLRTGSFWCVSSEVPAPVAPPSTAPIVAAPATPFMGSSPGLNGMAARWPSYWVTPSSTASCAPSTAPVLSARDTRPPPKPLAPATKRSAPTRPPVAPIAAGITLASRAAATACSSVAPPSRARS